MTTEKARVTAPAAPDPTGGLGSILGKLALLEKDWEIVAQVLAIWESARTLAVGESEPVPLIKVDINGKKYEWGPQGITRTG